nr:MAG TPA: hypothetical protein [Caudoviricetes sp.]
MYRFKSYYLRHKPTMTLICLVGSIRRVKQ